MVLKAGIIGFGKMGLMHSAILNSIQNVEVFCVAEPEKLLQNFCKKYVPEIEIYNNYEDLIVNSKPDFIYITTPVKSHTEICNFCIEKNINFFVEKPLGRNTSECAPLLTKLKEKKLINMVGFVMRFMDITKKAKELIDNESIGKIEKIEASAFQTLSFNKSSGWRFDKNTSGGGVLIDLGIHLIDLLHWFFGDIKSIESTESKINQFGIEDDIYSQFTFENGLNCSLNASWLKKNYRLPEYQIKVVGKDGEMIINSDYLKIKKDNNNSEKYWYKQSFNTSVIFDVAGPEFTREDEYFIDCIKNKKQTKLDIKTACKNQIVVDSIYKSSSNSSSVSVNYLE